MTARLSAERRRLLAAVFVLALVPLGFTLPPRVISSGVERHRADPLAHATAVDAHAIVGVMLSNPLSRIAIRATRVTRVWRDPGHCRDPRPNEAQGEYRATVRLFMWFGLPGPTMNVTCGGWHAEY